MSARRCRRGRGPRRADAKPEVEDGSPNPHHLYRNKRNGVLGGVCAGLADYLGTEAWKPRLVLIILLFTPIGYAAVIAYLIMWVILPKRTERTQRPSEEEETFWREVSLKPSVTFGRLRYAFRDLEERLAAMEKEVTSGDYRLRKAFREIER